MRICACVHLVPPIFWVSGQRLHVVAGGAACKRLRMRNARVVTKVTVQARAPGRTAPYLTGMAESLVSCAWLQEHWIDKREPNIVLLDGMYIINC